MSVFDSLPRELRDFYNAYPIHEGGMKQVQIAWHFDDPYGHILVKQVNYDLEIHEKLFNVTVSRRPVIHRGESYHPSISLIGFALQRNSRTT